MRLSLQPALYAVAAVFLAGFLAGKWYGERDLEMVYRMPVGGLYPASRWGDVTVWTKLDTSVVHYRHIPAPWLAVLFQRFNVGPSSASTTTTSTTTTTRPVSAPPRSVAPGRKEDIR